MFESYMKFWGKAGLVQNAGESKARWHPAACHMLDVAAVAFVYLEQANPAIPGIPEDPSRYWSGIAFIIALHDIGKFSRPFQQKRFNVLRRTPKPYYADVDAPFYSVDQCVQQKS